MIVSEAALAYRLEFAAYMQAWFIHAAKGTLTFCTCAYCIDTSKSDCMKHCKNKNTSIAEGQQTCSQLYSLDT